MKNNRENVIVQKSIAFALLIIEFCDELQQKKKFVIANQLLRSGTSIGANIHEAQSAESRNDFVHKMKIAAKEVSETQYWLTLCEKSSICSNVDQLQLFLSDINRILSKIIVSSKTATEKTFVSY